MANAVKEDWIKVSKDGKITCGECENEVELLTNDVEGLVKADTKKIAETLKKFPSKVIYGICPVCGMEYIFRLAEDELWLEPSEEEK